jgi:hypothetical protein
VSHIVQAAGTHSLISASVMSSRVITEATAYFERSAAALEEILATLQGKGADGTAKPITITSVLDPTSAQSISDTLKGAIQPQLDKHDAALASLQAQLGTQAQAIAENQRIVASVLLGEEGHIRRLEQSVAENQRLVASVLLGEEGHIRRLEHAVTENQRVVASVLLGEEGHIERLGRVIADLAQRVTRLEERHGKDEPPPAGRGATAGRAPEVREMQEAHDALRDRIVTLEASIRQLMTRGNPEGGGGRPPRRGG